MLIPKPRLCALFETSVTELQSAGVTLKPFECAWLFNLCERCINTPGHAPDFSRPSFECGGVAFHFLTVGAATWLQDYAAKWWPVTTDKWTDQNADMDLLSTAYAMAYSYEPDKFQKLTSKDHARLVIRTWATRLACSERELVKAIRSWSGEPSDAVQIDNPNEVKRERDEPSEWGATLCWLSYHYKQAPTWFLWNCTDAELALMVKRCPIEGATKSYTGNDADFEALRVLKKYLTELRSVPNGG